MGRPSSLPTYEEAVSQLSDRLNYLGICHRRYAAQPGSWERDLLAAARTDVAAARRQLAAVLRRQKKEQTWQKNAT